MVYGCHIFAPLAGQGGARCGGCGGRGDTEQWRWWRWCRPGLEDTARTLATVLQPHSATGVSQHPPPHHPPAPAERRGVSLELPTNIRKAAVPRESSYLGLLLVESKAPASSSTINNLLRLYGRYNQWATLRIFTDRTANRF